MIRAVLRRVTPALVAMTAAVAVACCAPAEPVVCQAQTAPTDLTFTAVAAHRDEFGRVIFLFGDSISRGLALGAFPDKMPADGNASNPLWPLRSPAAMMNAMLADAGVEQDLDACGELTSADVVAVYAGPSGQPQEANTESKVQRIRRLVSRGVIRPGDVVVFEDAGDHVGDPALYERNWIALRQALSGAGVTAILTTTYDNLERANRNMPDRTLFQYDLGPPRFARSHNAATRAAAAARVEEQSATLLDLNALLRQYEGEGVLSLQHDGVHPNVWGQCVFAAGVLQTLNYPLRSRGRLADVVGEHWEALSDTSAAEGSQAARDAWTRCIEVAGAARAP